MKNFTTIFLTAVLVLTVSVLSTEAQEVFNQTKQIKQTAALPAQENAAVNFGEQPPSNDMFTGATPLVLNGNTVSVTAANFNATKETGEPNHAERQGGTSVWYSLTPTATTVARIRTTNASFDTLLAVYKGGSVNNLTVVGSNDDCFDNCIGGSSTVDLMLTAGQTYRIAVDGYSEGTTTSSGAFTLEITALTAPAQDNYANAYNLGSSRGGGIAGTNFNATAEPGEPAHAEPATKSVWYKWTPSVAYSIDFELTENFKSAIKIYRAYVANPTLADLQYVATAVDAYGYTSSKYRTTFHADAGITYYIAIDGVGNDSENSGNFQLKFYAHRLRYSYRRTVFERTDLALFRPSNGTWYSFLPSFPVGAEKQFGASGDVPVPADYDGNGFTDFAVTRSVDGKKMWYIHPSQFVDYFSTEQWGAAGDITVTGDFDYDGVADLTAIRQTSNGLIWYVRQSSNKALRAFNWGANSDKPVIGDFDGDGATDVAVTRSEASGLVWYILKSGFLTGNPTYSQYTAVQFGIGSDNLTAEDYDGDGKTDIAVFRSVNGTWYVLRSSDNQLQAQQFGASGDVPQPADYNGDGKAEFGIFRPSNGTWYTSLNPATNYGAVQWGAAGDIPVSSMSALSQ